MTDETNALRHNVDDVNAMTAYVTMTRTAVSAALESWIQCVSFQIFYLYRFAILISWTLHRMLCIDTK